MGDDLVKRLRESCYIAFDDGTNDYSSASEAADHIEQLEAALKNLIYNAEDYGVPPRYFDEARAALAGEKKE